jgi:acetyl-CoA C-acetyltransferase
MADAFIYDAVRTPRERGKPDGALHTATALQLPEAGACLARLSSGAETLMALPAAAF